MQKEIYEDLFVLELANNHWGKLDRGLKIIRDFGEVVRRNNVRAALKLQFRDVGSFIHKQHRDREDVRYIKKVGATELSWEELGVLVEAIREEGMIAMATPFDEVSVDKCLEFDLAFIKIASSDIRDRVLLEKIASAGKPVIASSGGASLEDMDHLVEFFGERGLPFALNHCVSIYPSQDGELELNQIDFLKARYPDTLIGFSSHEMTDWASSMLIAYAKGARTFERHIDIDYEGVPVSPYCTLPHQADTWFRAFHKAREMCGAPAHAKRVPPEKEVRYLDELVRGVYAKRDLPAEQVLTSDDVYFAVPLVHGQISVREFESGEVLRAPIGKDQPVKIRDIESNYANDLELRRLIDDRGVPRATPAPPRELKRVAT
ncbi:MAG: N-acetylneuraminic acid synthase protein [Caulobacteraceae bacterium]|nr:N-acetylneuraminic acid synthase protein [Caulobacteraceae bacterium]